MKRSPGLYLALGLLCVAPALRAQGAGSIEGQVARENSVGIGGVTVVVNEAGEAAITDRKGEFVFSGLAAGTYSLSFTLGDRISSEENVEVSAGATTSVQKIVDWDISFAETITVRSASRRAERIVEAPAAISIVTDEQIGRQASHGQVPKLLEFTPGAEITQSGLYDFNLNTRGFNSSLNRRVASLVDGRDPSVPFLGSQEWLALSFALDDIENLEMVRGPSAALYGANASSGIINMITKRPKYSQGGLFRMTVGGVDTTNADFRYAAPIANEWYFKLQGGIRTTGDFTRSRNGVAEYAVPCTGSGQTDCLPQERVPLNPFDDNELTFYAGRLDKHLGNGDLFTIESGTATAEGPVAQTGIGRVQVVELDRPWTRANYSSEHFNLMAYTSAREAPVQTALSSGTNVSLDTSRDSAEAQFNWAFAEDKVRVVVGGSYSEEDIDTRDPATGAQTLIFQPVTNEKSALFGQVDFNIAEKVKLVLAGRLDENDLHSSQFSPKGSLVYSINPNSTLRFTYNEAFQVANYSEFFLQANVAAPINLSPFEGFCAPFGVSCGFDGLTRIVAVGNADLDLEEIKTTEIGYSGIIGGKLYLTVDIYQSDNKNFITDLIPQLGALPGGARTNPNFGPYQPPTALPAPAAAALLATLQGALGPSFFILTNNFDGDPILAAVSYTNFGDVDTEGADIGVNYYVDDKWTVNFTYSSFDFTVNNPVPGFENILQPNTPESKGSFGVSYVAPRWDFSASVRFVDGFRWAVGPFVGDVPSYKTADLGFNYQATDNVRLGLNVANAFDEEHWESFGGDILERRILGNATFSW